LFEKAFILSDLRSHKTCSFSEAELWIRIRTQGFDDQKLKKKKIQLKFFDLFLIKNCDLLCPSYRRSLHSSKENIQHFNPDPIRIRIHNTTSEVVDF
jgi:hypothetical protein